MIDTSSDVSGPVAPTSLPSDDAAIPTGGETIEIDDTAPAESASSVHLDRKALQDRSQTQVSDLLRQVPGLMVSQHAGGGKSDQYFIRGFDADHGTDIAIFADGVPVNMPSHGHGQGYADTHFVIPETIDAVDVHKGPYSARFGDFYDLFYFSAETSLTVGYGDMHPQTLYAHSVATGQDGARLARRLPDPIDVLGHRRLP